MFVCDGGGIVVSGVHSCCGLGTALGVGVVVYYVGSVAVEIALPAGGASPVPGTSRRWAQVAGRLHGGRWSR